MRHHSIERVINVPDNVTVTLEPTRDGQEIHIEEKISGSQFHHPQTCFVGFLQAD